MGDNIEESTEYENFLGQKEELLETASLSDFLDPSDVQQDESVFWKKHWKGMPEYEQEANPPHHKLIVRFRNEEDYQEFAKSIDQHLSKKTKSIWHPKLDTTANSLKRWVEDD